MKLKQTVSLMILAGLLTASLASCVAKGSGDDNPVGTGGSEPYYTNQTTTPSGTVSPSTDPAKVTYAAADETVYITKNNTVLKLASDTNQTITLGATTELHRTGKSTAWSKVQYQNAEYYVATSLLTTDDLAEKTFDECSKTMYVNTNSVNIRKYPSAEDFSEKVSSANLDTEVKVIAESSQCGWSKVEVKKNSSTVTGFIKNDFLSSTKSNVEESEYLKNFSALSSPVTMYVKTDFANMREKPFADNRGTIVKVDNANGLPKGTAVEIIAEGTVENIVWCVVKWSVGGYNHQYYIAKSSLSLTPSSTATLEQMLTAYPALKQFDSKKTLYVNKDIEAAFGRSTPDRQNKDNVVQNLKKLDQVIAVASGTLTGKNSDGETESRLWCLIEDAAIGYYFVSYDILTPNSDGTAAMIPVSLDELINNYGFSKLSQAATMSAKDNTEFYSAPNDQSKLTNVTVEKGQAVSVVARGTTTKGFVTNDWYIVLYNSTYYFVLQSTLELA